MNVSRGGPPGSHVSQRRHPGRCVLGGHPLLYGDTPISAPSSEPLGARPPLRSHDPQRFAQLTHPCVLWRPGPGRGRAPRAGRGCDRRLLVFCSLHRRTFGAVLGGDFTGATRRRHHRCDSLGAVLVRIPSSAGRLSDPVRP